MFLCLGAAAQVSGALREALAPTRVIHHFLHPGGGKKKERLGRASQLDERSVAGEPRVQDSAANICRVAPQSEGALNSSWMDLPAAPGSHRLFAVNMKQTSSSSPSQDAVPHTGGRSPLPLMRKWPVLKSIQQTNIRGQIKSGVAPSFPIPCPAPTFCLVREPTPFELAQKPSDFLRP